MTSLFAKAEPVAPLAERLRPKTLDEVIGQQHLIGPGKPLRLAFESGRPHSMILWGPPGSGKTTLARLMASTFDAQFIALSAVFSGVKDIREAVQSAEAELARSGRHTILFVDEVHRFNKAQQDAFLPHVESGEIVLVGATTENPSFEINAPLLSRCRVVVLSPLSEEAVATIIERALKDVESGLGGSGLSIDREACAFLATAAQGDARGALGALEAAADLARAEGKTVIDVELAEQGLQKKALLYDQAGDEHYNVVSAFIKSMRGSDVDASLYWLARMLEAGEDPIFIARRMVVFASEDIGLADAQALPLAVAAKDAVSFVGLPEARINLQHVVAYLALAPKSNAAYMAGEAAIAEVRASGALPVPIHLRNAPTGLMRKLGYGRDYVYPHGHEEEAREQSYLPERLSGKRFFRDRQR